MGPDAWLPGEVPAWLEEARRANRYYEFMGGKTTRLDVTKHWPPTLKRAYWSDIIAKEARKLDALPEDHPWHDPVSDRLGLMVDRLASRAYEEDFLEEMVRCLKEGACGHLRERLLGRRWQHWARFLGNRPLPSERRTAPAGRLLGRKEFTVLLRAYLRDGRARAMRDAAMFALTHGAAASTSDLASLDLADWDRAAPSMRVGAGRDGFEDRTVGLGFEAANLLTGWVALRGRKPGSFFYSLDRFGAVKSERISNATVHAALKERCKQARLSPIAPEDLRRTGLTRLFESGADLYAVADLAGHRTTEETQRYLRDSGAQGHAPHGETAFHKW